MVGNGEVLPRLGDRLMLVWLLSGLMRCILMMPDQRDDLVMLL